MTSGSEWQRYQSMEREHYAMMENCPEYRRAQDHLIDEQMRLLNDGEGV